MSFLEQMEQDTRSVIQGEFSDDIEIRFTSSIEPILIKTKGLFDIIDIEVDVNGNKIVNKNPRITVAQNQIEDSIYDKIKDDVSDDWQVSVRGKTYRIRTSDSDGAGSINILLKNID